MWSSARFNFGPLTFLIYINAMCNTSSLLHFILFADDSANVFASDKSLDILLNKINNYELETVFK